MLRNKVVTSRPAVIFLPSIFLPSDQQKNGRQKDETKEQGNDLQFH
jgi:hypothetical protein